ncbi:MAG: hypothetical protein IJ009_05485 [Clostridia bacterium]|nr:hypothetical protein [Clostridia bacterium]
MSDFDKKKKTEEDPIQAMLERLRKIVDTPVEKIDFSSSEKPTKLKKATSSAQNGKKKAAEPKPEVEELILPGTDEETPEDIPVLVEEVVEEVPAALVEEDAEEEDLPLDDEDEVDDETLSHFFGPEETETTEKIEVEPAQGPEEPADKPSFLPDDEQEEVAPSDEDDGREYDLLTLEDVSVIDDGEDQRDNSWKEAIAFPKRTDEPTAAPPITPESFALARPSEEEARPQEEKAVTEEDAFTPQGDADWLFRPRVFGNSFAASEEPKEEIPEEEELEEIEANEDNGYSVEVTVTPQQKAWYIPTSSQVETVLDTVSPTEELLHKIEEEERSVDPAASESPVTADEPSEPSFYTHEENDSIDTVDTDDTDDLHIPHVLQNASEADGSENTVHVEGEEEIHSFSWETVPPRKPAEKKKKSLRASFSSFFRGEGGDAKSQKRGVFFGSKIENEEIPEALSGIYNEAGADYHEYTSRNQIGLFSGRFVALVSSCTVRVIALAFLCTLLLLLEDLRYLGVTLGGFFARPGGMAAAHLLLMIFVILCCIPMLSHAWRHLFNNRVLPEAYLAIGLICALFYDVFLLLASVADPYLFGLVPAVGALILSVIDLLKTKGDFASFKLVSSSGDKLACSVSCGAQTRSEAIAVSDLEEGTDTRILSVKKVGFAAGFFHRVSRICEDGRKNLWLLIMALISSLATAIVCGILVATHILQQDGSSAVYAFCVSLSFSFPIFSLLLHKIPAVQLFSRATATRCAVVGEVSALEYCDAAAVAFEDVEAFPARNVRVQRIKLYGDAALDHVLYRVAGLFSVVGGPLDGVFRASTAEVGLSAEVRLLRAEEGGIVASVDGHEVCVGRGEYMLARNIHMYYDPDDEQNLLGGKVNIMYAAEDGHLIAKFYVRYKMDEDFERDVEELHKRGIRAIIRTYDPNVTEALVGGISYTERFDVRVVRKTVDQQNDFATDRLNSGIVCKTSSRDIVKTLFACRRMCQVIRVAENCNLLIACFGMLLSLLLCAFGVIFSVPSFFLALYQLIWVGLIAVGGKLYI